MLIIVLRAEELMKNASSDSFTMVEKQNASQLLKQLSTFCSARLLDRFAPSGLVLFTHILGRFNRAWCFILTCPVAALPQQF